MSMFTQSLRVLSLSAVLVLAATVSAGVVTQHYEFPEPVVSVSGERVSVTMDGAWSFGWPGDPVLPMSPARILLPPGESAISVTIVPGERVVLGSGYTVEPGQHQYPLSYDGPVERIEPDYAGRAPCPDRLADEPATGFFRGRSIASFALHPVEYVPSTGTLSYYRSMDVTVTTAQDSRAVEAATTMVVASASTERELSRMVDNPDARARYHAYQEVHPHGFALDPEPAYDYVVVASDAWGEYLDDFVDYKTKRGLRTKLFLTSWIYGRYPGVDEQEQIRAFIKDAYRTWGTQYVLLVGDTRDPNGIPHRGLYATVSDGGNTGPDTGDGSGRPFEVDNDIPGDIYYAALDGTWNDDGDGWWGEPAEADLYPEVAVGRICVNEPWEIENFIDKVSYYQESPIVSECDEALFVGEYLWPYTYGGDYKDEIRYGSSANGYTTAGVPASMNVETLYEKDVDDWPSSTLILLMENGVNIVNHLGHCNEHYVMKLTPLDISTFSNDGTEHSLNFIYSQGCYGGSFDNMSVSGSYTYDCFVEQMAVARVGAAAAIANSRYGWGDPGGTNGSSQYYDREFFDAMFAEGIYPIGEANNDSKADVVWAIGYSANRWCSYQLNLFGDPAMHLWTGEPTAMTVEHPPLILTDQDRMDVTVRGATGEPIEGARVAVYSDDGRVYDSGYTDSDGVGSVRATTPVSGTLRMKVMAHDHLDYHAVVPVISATEPYLDFAGQALDDDSEGASLGNSDGIVNAGESIEISVELENLGGGTAGSVSAELSCGSEFVTVTQVGAAFGDVAPFATAQSLAPFVVEVAPDAPDGESLEFALSVSDAARHEWTHEFLLDVSAPGVVYAAHYMDDGPEGGNGNGCAEADETVALELSLSNTGSAAATGLSVALSTTNPYVTINSGTLSRAQLEPGETAPLDGEYSLTFLEGCPPSLEVVLNVAIEADWGYSSATSLTLLTAGPGITEDIEGDLSNWYHDVVTAGSADAWHVESTRAHSGVSSWNFGGEGHLSYPSSSDGALIIGPLCIGAGPELRFWDWLQAEQEGTTTGWDCALVEVSVDYGATWDEIGPVGGYTHTKAWTAGNPLPNGTPCWSGSHDWREEVFDLSSLSGQTVVFRFRFASDEYVDFEGWYVDDVQVSFEGSAPHDEQAASERDLPAAFALRQNAPNPFNPATVIRYELPIEAHVRIDVYNVAGRLVRTVVDEPVGAGYNQAVWNGLDAAGHRVASGVYMYRMTAGDFESKRMMVLLK